MPAWLDTLHAFGLVGVAELGDKSQLVCLALASRFRAPPVVAGAAVAFGTLNLLAIGAGQLAAAALPDGALKAIAAAAMFLFGAWTLRADADEGAEPPARAGHPVLVTAAVLAMAELGDKTQLAVTALASVADPLATWLGATAALIGTSAVAAVAGGPLLRRLPAAVVRRAAGALFLLSGAWLLAAAVSG